MWGWAYLGIEDGVPAALVSKDETVLAQVIPQVNLVRLARLSAIKLARALTAQANQQTKAEKARGKQSGSVTQMQKGFIRE